MDVVTHHRSSLSLGQGDPSEARELGMAVGDLHTEFNARRQENKTLDDNVLQALVHPNNFQSPVKRAMLSMDRSPVINYPSDLGFSDFDGSPYVSNLKKCLNSIDMTRYFREQGLLELAEYNVNDFVEMISVLIRDAKLPLQHLPSCWQTRIHMHMNNVTINGVIGRTPFAVSKSDPDTYNLNTILSKRFHNWNSHVLSLACMPDVFLAGFPKCGSTYFYSLLVSHPWISRPLKKEPKWWDRDEHFSNSVMRGALFLADYLLNFRPAVKQMREGGHMNPNVRVLDASPSLLFKWPTFPNQSRDVNICLLPSVIAEFLPKARFLVIIREPVVLLYSAFLFSCTRHNQSVSLETQLKLPNIFHERVTEKIRIFDSCVAEYPLAKCAMPDFEEAFWEDLPGCGRTRLEMGLYHVHIQKWLSVVPRERFLFVTLDELSDNLDEVASQTWSFLNVSDFRDYRAVMAKEARLTNSQQTVNYRDNPRLAMRNDTRDLLLNFFRPYNQMLADLLGDRKFLWEDLYYT